MIAVGLVILVAGFNVAYFGFFGAGEVKTDESLAAKLLDYHSDLNPDLYAHHNAIKTIVLGGGIIPEAYAASIDTLEEETTAAPTDDDNGTPLSFDIVDNAIQKQNLSSTKGLVNIQVYTTQVGDTLASISKQYNISTDTIKWANNLTSDTIKPGWHLKILPINGVLVVAGPNTTLYDIVKKFGGNIKDVVAYNNLADSLDVDNKDVLVVPNGKMPAPPAPKVVAPKAGKSIAIPGKDTSLARSKGHSFAPGHCTDYVARRFSAEGRTIESGGNAKNWPANMKAYGATFDKNPTRGSIIVTTDNRRYGHVGYVESVDGNNVTFSEWNYAGLYKKTVRTLPKNDSTIRGFIHYKE